MPTNNLTLPKNRPPTTPGEMLEEEFIKPLGLTQQQFADALDIDRPALNMILNGKRRITPEMAMRLSIVLGTTPEVWLNLQMLSDLYEAKNSPTIAKLKKQLKRLTGARELASA